MTIKRNTSQQLLVPEFAGMGREEIHELREMMREERVDAGARILEQGDPGKALYFLEEGSVEVLRNGQTLATLQAPTVFGEIGFLTATAHVATVRALKAASVLALDREKFDASLAAGRVVAYKLVYNVAQRLAERLRRMDDWVVELLAQGPAKTAKGPELERFKNSLLKDWRF
mgnify:CR=1 FL=1